MIRLFLDANILIDVTDSTRITSKVSAEFIKIMFDNMDTYKLYTSCDLITTIYYVSRKELGRIEALQQIKTMSKFITIIEFGNREVDEAIKLMENNKKYTDLEDTIQYVMARKEKCDYIITNNKNFASGDVPVLSSKEALKNLAL
ncbi:MAG: type II toxin-antitoxin system VapC family toxin [Campylobacterota bacterium]|nr:type II toxin-antitoxin system VapC family toxin [Campylobacterota bacterium]